MLWQLESCNSESSLRCRSTLRTSPMNVLSRIPCGRKDPVVLKLEDLFFGDQATVHTQALGPCHTLTVGSLRASFNSVLPSSTGRGSRNVRGRYSSGSLRPCARSAQRALPHKLDKCTHPCTLYPSTSDMLVVIPAQNVWTRGIHGQRFPQYIDWHINARGRPPTQTIVDCLSMAVKRE